MLGGVLLHCCILVRCTHKRTATLYDLSRMLADESRTIQDLFKEMADVDHAARLEELFPGCEGGEAAHTFIASSAREMLNKAENVTSIFRQSHYVFLICSISVLCGFSTEHGYAIIRQKTAQLLVYLLVQF